MYQVTIDGKHLCSTNAANGFAAVEDPTAKLIVNGADSFGFTVYPQHPLYGDIVCKVSRVKIQQGGKLIFYGTVSGYTETLYGVRTYSCEGALSWLNELCLPAYHLSNMTPKQVLSWYIEMYNDTVQDESKRFTVGSVTIAKATTKAGTEGTIARSSGLFPTFWEEISEKLLDAFGGILRIRYKGAGDCAGVIDWLAIPDATCGQDIKYAKNLIDCDWSYDGTPIATAVIPLGKKQGGSTEDEVRIDIHKTNDASMTALLKHLFGHGDFVKSGNMVYSKSRVEKYGLIQQTVTFDDEFNTDTIAYLGAVWLDQNGKASSTIRAEAIDIADIDETVSHFVCGDYVRARLPGSTKDLIFPITAIEIPIAAPEDARITVGTQEANATSGGSGGGSIAEVGSGADALAHTHANKGVLDRITAQDYSDFRSTVNKAHVHQNQETLDKLDGEWWAMWLSAYGNMHTHANKAALDKITDALVTKLSNMDLTKYLPLPGGVMTGDIDMQTNKRDILVGTQKANTSDGTAVAGGAITTPGYVGDKLKAARSFVGTVTGNDGVWWDVISVRHRNGHNDGANYGMYLFSKLASTGNLSWNKQTSADTWQGERTLLDSVNYTSYALAKDGTAKKASNATTWNGLTQDCDTYNSADTWLLVKNGNKIQHRLSYELEVKRATTLTDTGWEALPRASTTPTLNYPGVNYRKYGKMVTVNGGVVFASDQSGPVIGQLPEGCRPVVQEICAVGIDKDTYNTFLINIKGDGTILFSTRTAGFFKKNKMYYINETFFVS